MTSSVTTTEIRGTSGRRIAFCEYGDPTGRPVVVVHGSPGSRYEGLSLDNAAATAGLRLIVPDRPGFGRTDPHTDKGLHSWDDDYVTLIDHLELNSAALMGFSGGGGYALAVAAAVPERVSKLVLACAMIPGAPRDTLRRRIKLVSALYFAANWAPRMAGAMLAGTGVFSKLRSDSVSIWPAADQAVMTDESHRPALQLDSSEGIAQGGSAGVVDLARYRHEMPGLLQSISVPTVFLHGTDDRNVPIEVARWAHSMIPHSRFEEVSGGGHLFVVADPTPLIRALT
jgi:pimeloyl-ACP methyl ester carboxylesterase